MRVDDAAAEDPTIRLERLNMWGSPARNLVAEMMILAGQVAATLGESLARLFRLALLPSQGMCQTAESCSLGGVCLAGVTRHSVASACTTTSRPRCTLHLMKCWTAVEVRAQLVIMQF